MLSKENRVDPSNREYHGHAKEQTRIYQTWRNMRVRCYNPKDIQYHNYGGRGIQVCEEWKSFTNFLEWAMNNGYTDELTIDRIDTDGDYCPENCRWISWLDQQKNKRNNIKIEYNGKEYVSTDLEKELGLRIGTISQQLRRGWTIEEILNKKRNSDNKKRYEYNGESLTISEWAKKLNLKPASIRYRLKAGYSLEEALSIENQRPNTKGVKKLITIDEVTKTLDEWCIEYNIDKSTYHYRKLHFNMDDKEAITTPVPKYYKDRMKN